MSVTATPTADMDQLLEKSALDQAVTKAKEIEEFARSSSKTILDITADIEVVELTEDELESMRQQIHDATLDTLNMNKADFQQTFADRIFNFDALVSGMGGELKSLAVLNSNELSVIKNAEDAVKTAFSDVEKIKAQWWRIFGKEGAIKDAQSVLQRMEDAIAPAKQRAEQMRQDRLRNASMDESIQEFTIQAENLANALDRSHEVLDEQVTVLQDREVVIMEIHQQALASIETIEKARAQLELDLKRAEVDIKDIDKVAQPSNYQEQENLINGIKQQIEEMHGKLNEATEVAQSKHSFMIQYQGHIQGLMKLRNNARIWYLKITSDAQERVNTFKAALEEMKAMDEQEAAARLNQIGTKVDEELLQIAGQAVVVGSKFLAAMEADKKRHFETIWNSNQAVEEHLEMDREFIDELRNRYLDKYGRDPYENVQSTTE